MTREEAIAILKSKLDGHTDTSYEWCECVRMAIEALDQEPCKCFTCKYGEWKRKGCKNCKHQIEPLRMCKWAEQGGDGQIHFVCPKWDKAESEE